jgi:hypothetical protein
MMDEFDNYFCNESDRVGRLVGWSVGRLVGWSVGRLVGWSVGRLVGWSVGRLVNLLLPILFLQLNCGKMVTVIYKSGD